MHLKTYAVRSCASALCSIGNLPAYSQSLVVGYSGPFLGWGVSAHGVEITDQLACLRELSCDRTQKYYFSKPFKTEEASTLLEVGLRQLPGPGLQSAGPCRMLLTLLLPALLGLWCVVAARSTRYRDRQGPAIGGG